MNKDKNRKKIKFVSRLNFELAMAPFLALLIAGILTLISLLLFYNVYLSTHIDEYAGKADETEAMMDDIADFIKYNNLAPDDIDVISQYLQQYSDFVFQVSAGNEEDFIRSLYDEINYIGDESLLIQVTYVNGKGDDYTIASTDDNTLHYTRYITSDSGFFVVGAQYKSLVKMFTRVNVGNTIFFIIVFVIVFSRLVDRKRRQLIVISNGLERLSGGDLSHRIHIKGKDEIASVAMHINDMSKALKERIDNEQKIEQTKNQLIANVSHDIRTPLTSITGYLALLKETDKMDSELVQSYVDICYNKAENLNHLVDQLFDYVLLTNHQMILNRQPIDMNVFMHQIVDENKGILENKGFMVAFHPYNQPLKAYIDVNRWVRVFDNLMSNILKYGYNEVPVVIDMEKDASEKIIIKVSNGVKSEDVVNNKDVFSRYFTSKRVEDGNDKSAGLGLAISKEIIEQHEGQIHFEIQECICTISIIVDSE